MNEINHNDKRAEWFALIDEQAASGLSQTEFCKQRNLVLCRFGYYKKLRASEIDQSRASFSPVVVNQGQVIGDIKIEMPNGFICHVPVGISPEKLKQIMGALISC